MIHRAWFSHLVRHPTRKRSGSILTTPEAAQGFRPLGRHSAVSPKCSFPHQCFGGLYKTLHEKHSSNCTGSNVLVQCARGTNKKTCPHVNYKHFTYTNEITQLQHNITNITQTFIKKFTVFTNILSMSDLIHA